MYICFHNVSQQPTILCSALFSLIIASRSKLNSPKDNARAFKTKLKQRKTTNKSTISRLRHINITTFFRKL